MRRIAEGVRNYIRAAALSNGGAGTTLAQQVAVILAKYGTDAHVYLPGIGVINGLTAGNYLDSAGTTAATVDNPVGLVVDSGGINVIQATTANKPILRRGAVNLLTYSEQFDNAAWTKSRIEVVANSINSPIGTLTADTLQTIVGATAGEKFARVGATVLANTTFSIYVKKSNWRYVHIRLINYSIFDFDTEAFTLIGANESISITKLSDGWYRLSTTNSVGGSATYGVGVASTGTTVSWAVPVDGTSVYAWGAQLETGSTASTYIPTTTAAASSATGNYHWVHDSTDVLTATFPAGYEAATTINASTAGQATLTAQNIVGAYNIGPSIDTYGRFVFRTGLTASELVTMQTFANRMAGV